jgi:Tfp pilus assembly protein PilX
MRSQRGATLAVTLIVLLGVMLTAVAVMRSVDTATLLARNTSFQRDAVNRNELVIRRAMREFEAVAGRRYAELANTDTDAAGQGTGIPYKATAQPVDSQGVPLAIRDDASMAAMFGALAGGAAARVDSGEGMRTVYMIERMCSLQQPAAATHCTPATTRAPDNCSRCSQVQSPFAPVFRVTARTNGPRGAETVTQVLFSLPMD